MQARYTKQRNRPEESRLSLSASFVLCRTYLENRILKIQRRYQRKISTSEDCVGRKKTTQEKKCEKEERAVCVVNLLAQINYKSCNAVLSAVTLYGRDRKEVNLQSRDCRKAARQLS